MLGRQKKIEHGPIKNPKRYSYIKKTINFKTKSMDTECH